MLMLNSKSGYWLNTSFLMGMMSHCAEHVMPDLFTKEGHMIDVILNVFFRDSLKTSCPMVVDAAKHTDIEEEIECICNTKGCALFDMIIGFVSESVIFLQVKANEF